MCYSSGTYVELDYAPNSTYHSLFIAVRQRNLDLLEAAALSVSDPQSLEYGKHWSRSKVGELTSNRKATKACVNFLVAQNVEIIWQSTYGELIRANASVGAWNTLLNTTFFVFAHVTGDPMYPPVIRSYNYTLPVKLEKHIFTLLDVSFIPALLPGNQRLMSATLAPPDVQEIFSMLSPPDGKGGTPLSSRCSSPVASMDAVSCELDTWVTPATINRVFGIKKNNISSSASQAIYSGYGNFYSPDDLEVFSTSLLSQRVTAVDLAAAGAQLGGNDTRCWNDPNSCLEPNLDLQYISAVAQGPILYNSYDTFGGIPLWLHAVSGMDSPPHVISISYGYSESELLAWNNGKVFMEYFDFYAQELALMGTSILVASGDHGSKNKAELSAQCVYDASWPGSSPWVTSVGGTHGPESKASDFETSGAYKEERATSLDRNGWSSGGGFSAHYERPAWQSTAVSSYLNGLPEYKDDAGDTAGTPRRGFPDVSALSHFFLVRVNSKLGEWWKVSGTSASCPVVAGLVSHFNAARMKKGFGTLGFLNPLLYSLARSSKRTSLFKDIVLGNNDHGCAAQGYDAAVGWDPLTGLGTLNFPNLLSLMAATEYFTEEPTPAPSPSSTVSPSSAPTPAPSAAAALFQLAFTLDGLSIAPTKQNIISTLARALGLSESLILDVMIDGAKVEKYKTQQARRLLSSSVTAVVNLPTSAAVSTFTSISASALSSSIVSSFLAVTGNAATVAGITVVNVTPTAAPTLAPIAAPKTDSGLNFILIMVLGVGVGGLVVLGYSFYLVRLLVRGSAAIAGAPEASGNGTVDLVPDELGERAIFKDSPGAYHVRSAEVAVIVPPAA